MRAIFIFFALFCTGSMAMGLVQRASDEFRITCEFQDKSNRTLRRGKTPGDFEKKSAGYSWNLWKGFKHLGSDSRFREKELVDLSSHAVTVKSLSFYPHGKNYFEKFTLPFGVSYEELSNEHSEKEPLEIEITHVRTDKKTKEANTSKIAVLCWAS